MSANVDTCKCINMYANVYFVYTYLCEILHSHNVLYGGYHAVLTVLDVVMDIV